MTNPIISNALETETNLAEVLGQINLKLDKLLDNVNDLKVGQVPRLKKTGLA